MPTELTERQKSILNAVIRDYVATAEPVASADLVRKYRLAYSPATVRNELMALDQAGYLAQPHTSAGRLPTDKGYRYFIAHLGDADGLTDREERELAALRGCTDALEFAKQSSRLMAHLTRNLALAGFPEEDLFYKSGLQAVMQEPEFGDLDLMHEFSALVDHIEEAVVRYFDPEDYAEPQTFIGSENPIREARRYGMIVSSLATPFGKESLIALVGPKRMDYQHNLAILRHFREVLKPASYEWQTPHS